MTKPNCPICEKHLTFFFGMKITNPWRIPCPHCNGIFEAGRVVKTITIVSALIGLGFGFFLSRVVISGQWETTDALIALAAVLAPFGVLSYFYWPHMKFYKKRGTGDR